MRLVVFGLFLGAGIIAAALYWDRHAIISGHMKPTLLTGDIIVSEPLRGQPERSDVVVYRDPVKRQDFVFRVVGLPGDKVQMIDGQLYLNGDATTIVPNGIFTETMEPQGWLQIMPRCSNGWVEIGSVCEKQQFTETLPGAPSYEILNIGTLSADTTGIFDVPPEHYFVLGDNRDNANDSRFGDDSYGSGFIAAENIRGRAMRVLYSYGGASAFDIGSWRSGRFGLVIE